MSTPKVIFNPINQLKIEHKYFRYVKTENFLTKCNIITNKNVLK